MADDVPSLAREQGDVFVVGEPDLLDIDDVVSAGEDTVVVEQRDARVADRAGDEAAVVGSQDIRKK